MRQMDTILVAVGVPTKEVPGASFALPQCVTVKTGTMDIPDQDLNEQQTTETQNTVEDDGTPQNYDRDVREAVEADETGDGWDIPDISDLLDSLNDTESEGKNSGTNSSQLISQEEDANSDTASAFNAQCDSVEETDPDSEHISWSWDDTHWTTEHTHKQKGTNL